MRYKDSLATIFFLFFVALYSAKADNITISGYITDAGENAIPLATVGLEGVAIGCNADDNGYYSMEVPLGSYTLSVSAVGYSTIRKDFTFIGNNPVEYNVTLHESTTKLNDVVISANYSGISRTKRSAYNVVTIDTKEYLNSTKNLSDMLAKTPGLKLREAGGVGSDIQISLDGFSGKHVKIFIDGVPQEGVGKSFSLNNIPVNYAKHIEVYRGVVPVNFGTDAMGGVINIVTNKRREGWNVEASYSYGSFNTHKSFVNYNHKFKNGFTYEIHAFQNYSDNDYHVNAPIEDFETGRIEKKKLYRVKRFNDKYHNEAVVIKAGITDKSWADRLLFGFTYSQMYKDIQNGVRQEIVYGEKHRKGYSMMPSVEYSKRNLLLNGLDVAFTANYNMNSTTNVDTAKYKYNWRGETTKINSPGEQSYIHTKSQNDNWNATFNVNYRLGGSHTHLFTLHHVFNTFKRKNTSLLLPQKVEDPIDKITYKNITGLSYRFMPNTKWNITTFGKYYGLEVSGPVPTTSNQDDYVKNERSMNCFGYGIAGTYFIIDGLQAKLSYEKAYRLPTTEEIFGDEDLESGDINISPENSHNINFNISYNGTFGKHSVYAEGGLVYRDTHDYIQRNIIDLSGGRAGASYINYGKVLTKGYNISLRYTFENILSVGGNFTQMEVLDNMKYAIGSSAPNIGYKERMPNLPCIFADFDATLYWHNLFKTGNLLTITYDTRFVEEFSYYSSKIGANKDDYMVPNQLSHDLSLTYSIKNGRYNFSFECRNITDERLYDNFSLQKAGRAFYGKIRVCFGN